MDPRQTVNLTQGDISENFVIAKLSSMFIIADSVKPDRYGIDLLCRYQTPSDTSTTISGATYPPGGYFLGQVKSSRTNTNSIRFDKEDIKYWMKEGLLVVIFFVFMEDSNPKDYYWASVEDHISPICRNQNEDSKSFNFEFTLKMSIFRKWIEEKYNNDRLASIRPSDIHDKLESTGIGHILYRVHRINSISRILLGDLEMKKYALRKVAWMKDFSFDYYKSIDFSKKFVEDDAIRDIKERANDILERFSDYTHTESYFKIPFGLAIDEIIEITTLFTQLIATENLLIDFNTCPHCGGRIEEDDDTISSPDGEGGYWYHFVGCERHEECGYVLEYNSGQI